MKNSLINFWNKSSLLPVLIISLVTGLTYIRGLNNSFVAEDFVFLSTSGQTFAEMWQYMVSLTRMLLVFISFGWALFRLCGKDPVVCHLAVLVLHVGVSLLLFYVASLLSGDKRIGFISALIYAVYPRHHQPVLWLAAASEMVLVVLFSLACIYTFKKYLNTRWLGWQILTLLSLCAAILSHEVGVILFPLLPLIELILHSSEERNTRAWLTFRFYYKYVPYLVLFGLYFLMTFGGARLFKLSTDLTGRQLAAEGFQYETYHLTGLSIDKIKYMLAYLTYLAYPQIPLRLLDPNLLTAMLALVTSLFLLFLLAKGSPIMRFSILWMVLAILPFVLFVPFGNADRYFYLPAAGFSVLVGTLACRGYDKLEARWPGWGQVILVCLLALYLVSSIILIQQRIGEWHRAGEIAADVVAQTRRLYPDVPPESTMLFVALPGQYKQAYVFLGGGIGGAVYLAYGAQPSAPRAYQTRDPEVVSFLKEAELVEHPLPGVYVFLYEDGVLYDRSEMVNSLEPLRPGTWSR
jgi:hypothetical protein